MNKPLFLALASLLIASAGAGAEPVEIVPLRVGAGESHSYLHVEFDDGAIYVFDVHYSAPSVTTGEMVEAVAAETALTYTTLHDGQVLHGVTYDGHVYEDWDTGFWSLWFRQEDVDPWTYSQVGWRMLPAADGNWHGLVADPGFTFSASPGEVILVSVDGDLNGDGSVGQNDLDVVLGHWGQFVPAGGLMWGDASGDGFVGQTDLDLVLNNWGSSAMAGAGAQTFSSTPVPAPSALMLLAVSGLGMLGRAPRGSTSG